MTSAPDTAAVVGNGASLARLPRGAVLETDYIIRTNNFFFEPIFHVGARVDLAVIAGDPRVARFIFATLAKCGQDYDMRAWTSHDARVIACGKRRFRDRYQDMPLLPTSVRHQIAELETSYGARPMAGTRAVMAACALGIRNIRLVGVDFYAGPKRYAYEPGPRCRALLGSDLGSRGVDRRLHDPALDQAIFAVLQDHLGANIVTVSETTQPRPGLHIRQGKRRAPPNDWVAWDGLYWIWALVALRRGKALLRRLYAALT